MATAMDKEGHRRGLVGGHLRVRVVEADRHCVIRPRDQLIADQGDRWDVAVEGPSDGLDALPGGDDGVAQTLLRPLLADLAHAGDKLAQGYREVIGQGLHGRFPLVWSLSRRCRRFRVGWRLAGDAVNPSLEACRQHPCWRHPHQTPPDPPSWALKTLFRQAVRAGMVQPASSSSSSRPPGFLASTWR